MSFQLPDDDAYCPACRGKGYFQDGDRPPFTFTDCGWCQGTGRRGPIIQTAPDHKDPDHE